MTLGDVVAIAWWVVFILLIVLSVTLMVVHEVAQLV